MAAVTTAKEVAPAERLARLARAGELANGTVRIPLACVHCFSPNLDEETWGEAQCVACGRTMKVSAVHTIRKQRIARFLRTGDR